MFVGNYESQIDEALADQGLSDPTNFQKQNSLFYCVGPPDGQIAYLETCQQACVNAGHNNDDHCLKDDGVRGANGHNGLKDIPPTKGEQRKLVINW